MSGTPALPPTDAAVVDAMQRLRATSARRAVRKRELPDDILARLPDLEDRGLIREGAPGEYYLYLSPITGLPTAAAPRGASFGGVARARLFKIAMLWLLVLLLPILVLRLSR